MSNSVRPRRRQPTRLPRPWDSPGKNTGVGCHFLLQCMKVKSESEVPQSCPTPSDPMDCSLPGSSVHGILQARVLEWGATAFSDLPVPSCFNHVGLFATLWTLAHHAPLSMGFSRQEYWNGLQCPPPGDLPNPGVEPMFLMSPALAGRFFTTSATWHAIVQLDGYKKNHPHKIKNTSKSRATESRPYLLVVPQDFSINLHIFFFNCFIILLSDMKFLFYIFLQSGIYSIFSGHCVEEQSQNNLWESIHCNRRRQWHPTPVLLPGKSYGRRSLVGCSPWRR